MSVGKAVIFMTAVLTAPQIERYAGIFSDRRSDWECGQNVREYEKKIHIDDPVSLFPISCEEV